MSPEKHPDSTLTAPINTLSDNPPSTTKIKLPYSLKVRTKTLAAKRGMYFGKVIEQALEEFLNSNGF